MCNPLYYKNRLIPPISTLPYLISSKLLFEQRFYILCWFWSIMSDTSLLLARLSLLSSNQMTPYFCPNISLGLGLLRIHLLNLAFHFVPLLSLIHTPLLVIGLVFCSSPPPPAPHITTSQSLQHFHPPHSDLYLPPLPPLIHTSFPPLQSLLLSVASSSSWTPIISSSILR